MKPKNAQPLTHKITGKFLGFLPQPKKEFKYIQLEVGERIIAVKLAKELREKAAEKLVQGDSLAVYLEGKGLGSKLKLKTDHIERLNATAPCTVLESPFTSQQGKILLCYNSSCVQRGGKKLYYALTETLQQLGLQDKVRIQMTGCQKQCKKAPSFILMPGKVTHNYVHPQDLPALLEAHYLKPENAVNPYPSYASV